MANREDRLAILLVGQVTCSSGRLATLVRGEQRCWIEVGLVYSLEKKARFRKYRPISSLQIARSAIN